jgi:hypothetical protein
LRNDLAENLLALFTARDVAESIVGDLVEQRHAHGRVWFACEVARLAFALCFKSLVAAPWRAIRLAALGWAVYFGTLVVLFAATGLPWYPWHRVNEPGFWARLGLVVFAANLVAGGVLSRWASKGGSAIAPLTTVWLVGWFVSPFMVALVNPWPWAPGPAGIVWTTVLVPLLYVAPVLLGALVAQRRDPNARRSAQPSTR